MLKLILYYKTIMKKSKLLLSVSLISLIISFENLSFSDPDHSADSLKKDTAEFCVNHTLKDIETKGQEILSSKENSAEFADTVFNLPETFRKYGLKANIPDVQKEILREEHLKKLTEKTQRAQEALIKAQERRLDNLDRFATPGETSTIWGSGQTTWDPTLGSYNKPPKIKEAEIFDAAESVMTQDERNAISAQNYDPNNFNNQGILKAVAADATSAQAAEPVASATSSLAEKTTETVDPATEQTIAQDTVVLVAATTSANETAPAFSTTGNTTDASASAIAAALAETPAPATAAANISAGQGESTEIGSSADSEGSGSESTPSGGYAGSSSGEQSTGNQQENSQQQQGQTNEESKPAESDESEDDLDPDKVKAQEVSEGDKEDAVKAQNHLKNSGIELNDKASHAQQIIDLATRIEARLKEIAQTSDEAIKQLINNTAQSLVVPVPQFEKPGDDLDAEGKLTFLQQQISALADYKPATGTINEEDLASKVNAILKAENDLMDNFEAFTKVSFAETFSEIKNLQAELTAKISEFEEIAKNAKTAEEKEMAERQAEALRAQEAAAARAVDEATQKFDQLKTEAQSKHQSATSETETSLSNIATNKVKSTRVRAQTLGTSKQAAEKLEKQKVRLTALNVKVTALSSEFKVPGAKFSDARNAARTQIVSLSSNRAFKKHIEDKNLSTLVSIFGQALGK